MANKLYVSTECPECGAVLRYPEGAYTFRCSFCASVLRIESDGVTLKYIIPSRHSRKEVLLALKKILLKEKGVPSGTRVKVRELKTVYKPFWYFKGMIYACFSSKGKSEIHSKTCYYTFQANPSFVNSFHSLGVRAEVLAIEPFDSERFREKSIVLPLTVDREGAAIKAEELVEYNMKILSPGKSFYRISLVGEKYFVIYYPVWQVSFSTGECDYTCMIDGINRDLLEFGGELTGVTEKDNKDDTPYMVEIISHRCKNCGHDLEARDFDIVYYCTNCFRLWLLKGNDYCSQKIRVLEGEEGGGMTYLPFWRFELTISSESAGIKIETLGDLSRFMKMGRYLLKNEDPERGLRFYVPALVTRNAKALIKLAAKIGALQKELRLSEATDFPYQDIRNASLHPEEAEEMLKPLIFMVIGRTDRKAVAFYRDFKISVTAKELVWYPFEEKGSSLRDTFHNYQFPKRSMDINVY